MSIQGVVNNSVARAFGQVCPWNDYYNQKKKHQINIQNAPIICLFWKDHI